MSDDEELLYGLLGTQFNTDADEQTEFKRSKLKRKAADEEVVDAKGRATRFHGAFTGGFSAGYFNTVGSKEGFQTVNFVSQRNAKERKYRHNKPEDFMDEDDFGENGIAPRLLRTKSIFDNEDIRNHMKQSLGTSDIIGDSDLLKDILVPQSITIGLVLLRKLGYLASRGIGEKATLTSSEIDEEEMSATKKFDYEAEETFQLIAKSDKFGLGYSGMCRNLISASITKHNTGVTFGLPNKKGIRGMAFCGVDEDDDDGDLADVYGFDSMSKYNYEYIDEKDDKVNNFGWTAPKNLKNAIMPSNSIPGFQIGSKCCKSARINYEPLKPPRFYLPIYPVRRAKGDTVQQHSKPERVKLMPNDEKGSVFSLLSASDRERLQNMGKENQTRKVGSRWGDAKPVSVKEESHDISTNLTNIRNEAKMQSMSSELFESPRKPELKIETRKSWALTSNLSSKFKSAGSSTSNDDMNYHLKHEIKATGNDLELSTKELAAKEETYGFMTRSILEWHPDKLLCKRFNVPDPYPGSKIVGIPDEIEFPTERPSKPQKMSPDHTFPAVEPVPIVEPKTEQELNIDLPMSDTEKSSNSVEIKTIIPDLSNKPPIDLFKAVFDDSDADFSSSEDEQEPQTSKTPPEKVQEETPTSSVLSMEQVLGAMMGDNPHAISSQKPHIFTTPKESPRIFGPTPPPDFVYNAVIPVTSFNSTNDIISKNIIPSKLISEDHRNENDKESYVYLEKSELKMSKHEKKSKKTKKSKGSKKSKDVKKDKHKKKKNKKRKCSSDSDSSD